MTRLERIEFEFDRATALDYLGLTAAQHADDPLWIAPLRRATLAQLAPQDPFYRDVRNRHRGFAVRRGGRLVGHVKATVDAAMRDADGAPVGALGFLESIPDFEVFRALVEPAIEWVYEATPALRVWATMNFDIWHAYRVMTRGFDRPAFLGEPRNGEWLPEFLDRAGFGIRRRWISTTAGHDWLVERLPLFEARHRETIAAGYRIEPFRPRRRAHRRALHRAVMESFSGFLGFTPLDEARFDALVGRYLRLVSGRLARVLRSPDGAYVGFSIAFADPAAALRRLRGHDDWLHLAALAMRRAPTDTAVYYLIGVIPEARRAARGLGSALLFETLRATLDAGYRETVFALLAEDSPARFFATDQAERAEREYALFETAR